MPQYVIVIYVTTQDVDKLANEVSEISFNWAEVQDIHIDEVYEEKVTSVEEESPPEQ